MKLNSVSVWSRKKVRNANITREKKIIDEKNKYKIGDVLIFFRMLRVISLRRSLLVSNMLFPNPSFDVENKVLYIKISQDNKNVTSSLSKILFQKRTKIYPYHIHSGDTSYKTIVDQRYSFIFFVSGLKTFCLFMSKSVSNRSIFWKVSG